jgi:hypothetical protein
MKLVIVESPYAGDVPKNLAYARAAVADCLQRGESPYASHLLYTQPGVLDDSKVEERELGMRAGFAWGEKADLTAAYTDLGVSRDMIEGLAWADAAGRPVEERTIPGWVYSPCSHERQMMLRNTQQPPSAIWYPDCGALQFEGKWLAVGSREAIR